MTLQLSALQKLERVIERLTAPDGCPWDREQTPESLCEYVLEEAYELVEAVRHGSGVDVREEMGDVLFLLVFIGTLYARKGLFSLEDAITLSVAKMVRRHPHVFAGTVFSSKEEQLSAWERIKCTEKTNDEGAPAGIFHSLPKSLPPLLKAYRVHSKAARVGFTWDGDEDVEQQVEAEWLELIDAFASEDRAAQERELGDVIFTLVELGRRKGIKASAAVDGAAHRFLARFTAMESLAKENGKDFNILNMKEKNALWNLVKAEERHAANAQQQLFGV